MSDDLRPSEESFLNAAVLLAAADYALLDDMDPDTALNFARRQWLVLNEEPWADGKHYGDCTKQAMTCNRCLTQDYEEQARKMWDEE